MATETTSLLGSSAGDGAPPASPRQHHVLVGRRFARFLARVIPDYGVHGSLEEAWDYFETIVLPRRMSDGRGGFRKAPVGTTAPTWLYSAWSTPQRDLRDFGTGIAVYFETLRALVAICLVAWVLYLPSIRYYQSESYSANQGLVANGALRGSLMCSETEWVPCPTCVESEWHDDPSRFARDDDNPDLVFILRNACAPLRWQEGVNHLVVLVFLIAAIVGLGYHQKKMELQYDEDVLTASDFSIVVNNPPPDATDPEEWKEFFSQFGDQVVYCTVALDDEELVAALVKRRALLQKAGFDLEGRSDDMPLQELPDSLKQSNKKLYHELQDTEAKCLEHMQRKHSAMAVFVTFETERGQRTVLEKLSVGKISVVTNDTSVLDPRSCFRSYLVLDAEEAKEPSVIRWPDLNETLLVQVGQRFCTGLITILLIALGFFAVKKAFQFNLTLAAFLIAILNIAVPNIFKLVNTLESHDREGSYQASLYAKISFFRFFNTAIVTIMIKPFTATISSDKAALLPAVYAVLKAEIVTAPILHMLDIVNQVKRHILAPRAANQAGMNNFFRGSRQNLGEKYTNMTKIIFLCFFYSVIFPSSFFFGALAIAATYLTDKFLLLRSWGPMPELGDDVARLSRRFFFPLTLVVLAVVSEFYWSAYPFDNTCDSDEFVDSNTYPEYIGTHHLASAVDTKKSSNIQVMLEGDGSESIYRFCDEDYLERVSALLQFFKAEKDDWMTADQQVLTFLFGIFIVAVVVVIGLVALIRDIWPDIRGVVRGDFTTVERDSGERFSDQENIQAYVPQARHRFFFYPLLACDISHVEARHIGWTDPLHSHQYYNLHNDVVFLQKQHGRVPKDGPVLSLIGHWGAS